jgi:hypothetical protein
MRSKLATVSLTKWLTLSSHVSRLLRTMRAPWLMVGTATERKRSRRRAWKPIQMVIMARNLETPRAWSLETRGSRR